MKRGVGKQGVYETIIVNMLICIYYLPDIVAEVTRAHTHMDASVCDVPIMYDVPIIKCPCAPRLFNTALIRAKDQYVRLRQISQSHAPRLS